MYYEWVTLILKKTYDSQFTSLKLEIMISLEHESQTESKNMCVHIDHNFHSSCNNRAPSVLKYLNCVDELCVTGAAVTVYHVGDQIKLQ